MTDKYYGCFLGLALGDALGAPHEFQKQEYNGILDKCFTYSNRFTGSKTSALGQVTDDTEMTISLLRSYDKNYDQNKAIESYLDWSSTRPPFMGKNTRAYFYGIKTIEGVKKRKEKIELNEVSQSNGCLMRAAGLIFESDLNKALDDTRLTNNTPNCILSVALYLNILQNIVKGAEKTFLLGIIDNFQNKLFPGDMKDCLAILLQEIKENEISCRFNYFRGPKKGWVLTSLYASLKAFFLFSTYQDGIDWVIRLGGDTDTNGAIAGALLGAYLGWEKMGAESRTPGNLKVLLDSDSRQSEMIRPDEYHPKQFFTLINSKSLNK